MFYWKAFIWRDRLEVLSEIEYLLPEDGILLVNRSSTSASYPSYCIQ